MNLAVRRSVPARGSTQAEASTATPSRSPRDVERQLRHAHRRACVSSCLLDLDAAGSLVEAGAHPEHLEHGAHPVERPQLGSRGSEHVQRRNAGGLRALMHPQRWAIALPTGSAATSAHSSPATQARPPCELEHGLRTALGPPRVNPGHCPKRKWRFSSLGLRIVVCPASRPGLASRPRWGRSPVPGVRIAIGRRRRDGRAVGPWSGEAGSLRTA
jgi:hypothetical protein